MHTHAHFFCLGVAINATFSQGDEALRLLEEEMETQDVGVWSTKYYGHMEHGWTDPSSDVYDPFQGELAHQDMFAAYRLLFGSGGGAQQQEE